MPTRTAHLSVMMMNFEGGERDEESRLPQVPRSQTEDIPPVTAQPEGTTAFVEAEYRQTTAQSPKGDQLVEIDQKKKRKIKRKKRAYSKC